MPDPEVDLDRVALSPTAATANLGDEMVLMDTETGMYFGVNEVGARIVELLVEPRRVSEMVDVLLAEFEVTRGALTRDVVGFLDALEGQGLLVRASPER